MGFPGSMGSVFVIPLGSEAMRPIDDLTRVPIPELALLRSRKIPQSC
jgi:hypothetical protein